MRDLLQVQADLKDQLPQDGSANGFDNAGAALHTSSFLMEKYLEAAKESLDYAAKDPKSRAVFLIADPRQSTSPDEAAQKLILVDNPAKVYGF